MNNYLVSFFSLVLRIRIKTVERSLNIISRSWGAKLITIIKTLITLNITKNRMYLFDPEVERPDFFATYRWCLKYYTATRIDVIACISQWIFLQSMHLPWYSVNAIYRRAKKLAKYVHFIEASMYIFRGYFPNILILLGWKISFFILSTDFVMYRFFNWKSYCIRPCTAP